MKHKRNFIYVILVLSILIFILFINTKETNSESTDIDEIETQITQELGKEEAKELLKELKEMSEVTRDNVIEKCGEYGIALSDIQLDSIVRDIKNWGEESGFFETSKSYISKFWEWIKQLGKNSDVEVDANPDEEQPIIKKDGENITITIPKTKDVDNFVDGVIDKVKDYINSEE